MKHYFYHGFEPYGYLSENVEYMIDIINSGEIKKRNEVSPIHDNALSHVCLYRKNEDFDYNSQDTFLHSARGSWIDNCMVFVISDDINAAYLPPNTEIEGFGLPTNLVDEWRCFENIPLSKIKGIALPIDSIRNTLAGKGIFSDKEEITKLRSALVKLKEICKQHGFKIYNSEEKDFTDKIDSKPQPKEKKSDIDI